MSPEEFYAYAMQAADAEGRLPLSRMTGWEVLPFEQAGLRVIPWPARSCPSLAGQARTPRTARHVRPAGRRSGPMSTGDCRRLGRRAPR